MSLPLLSWHVLSRGWCGRPRCRQRQHQCNKGNNAGTTRVATLHNEGDDSSTKRMMMPLQLMMPVWQERTPAQQGGRRRWGANATMECGYSYLRLLLYANWQHINVCKHLIMSNVEVGSSLRWLSASTMTKMHHFYSTSDHVPQNLSQVGWVWLCKATIISLWTADWCTQTLCNV